MDHDVTTLEQLESYAESFLGSLSVFDDTATLITLTGDLGAGKTTFTQILGKKLGVTSEVTSPTYVIEQRYDIEHEHFSTLVHIDAYRLEQEDDALKIGLDQTLNDPKNLVIIEWPEKIADFLEKYLKTDITIELHDGVRMLSIE